MSPSIPADGTRRAGTRRRLHPDESVAREGGDGVGVERLERPLAVGRRGAGSPRAAAGTSPRTAPACAAARSAGRATGTSAASGHSPQRGTRARQTVAPRSISACAAADENVVPGPLRDAAHVDVDGQDVAAERKARDGVGGVAPDAGQLGQVVRPAVRRDVLRRTVQVERAPVVAEPLPLPDHVGRRGARERLDRRPALEPALPARYDARRPASAAPSPRDEDRVRIARPPPGEVAPALLEPEKQILHGRERSGRASRYSVPRYVFRAHEPAGRKGLMLTYVARRLLYSIPVLIVSTFLSFTFISLAGDPTANLRANPKFSAITMQHLQHTYHLDRSIPVRYGYWVEDVFTHKLGTSLTTSQPIWPDIKRTFGHTGAGDPPRRDACDHPRDRRRDLLGDAPVLDLRLLLHVVQLPRLRDADVLARAAAPDPVRRHLSQVARAASSTPPA